MENLIKKNLHKREKYVCILAVTLVACFFNLFIFSCFGPGLSDWEYELPNDYYVVRVNSDTIGIGIKNENGYSYSTVIDNYIVCFAYNDKYVCARRFELAERIRQEEILKMNIEEAKYCIINTETNDVYGSLTAEEYETLCNEFNIIDLCDWINTYPTPDGAHF